MKKIIVISLSALLTLGCVACGDSSITTTEGEIESQGNIEVYVPSGYEISTPAESESSNDNDVIINAESQNNEDYYRIRKFDSEDEIEAIMDESEKMNAYNNYVEIEEFKKGELEWEGFSVIVDGVKGIMLEGENEDKNLYYIVNVWGHELDSDEVTSILESIGK